MAEKTLSIIKPDAVQKGVIGKIIDRFESNGLRIAAMKKLQLSKCDAQAFYANPQRPPIFQRSCGVYGKWSGGCNGARRRQCRS